MKTLTVLLSIFALALAWAMPSPITDVGVMCAGITLLPAIMTDAQGNEIPPLTRAQKKLFDYLRMKSNVVTLEALQVGALKWDNVTYYIRKVITGLSGRQALLNSATAEVVGVCNLDKGQLPQYYNFAYDRIEVSEAINNTSASLAVTALASYSSVLSSMDAGLRNGELIVQQNRVTQVETPVTDFGSKAAVTGGGAKDFDGGALDDPQIWVEQQQVEVDVNLAQVISSATNTTYAVEVLFKGAQIRLR